MTELHVSRGLVDRAGAVFDCLLQLTSVDATLVEPLAEMHRRVDGDRARRHARRLVVRCAVRKIRIARGEDLPRERHAF